MQSCNRRVESTLLWPNNGLCLILVEVWNDLPGADGYEQARPRDQRGLLFEARPLMVRPHMGSRSVMLYRVSQ